jgi:ADP-heptose:LPS heptosyltransferase
MKLIDDAVREAATRRWRAVRNVLAVRLDQIGDVLMTTPALAAVAQCLPEARLTLLASPAGAAVARHVPFVGETITYQAPWAAYSAQRESSGYALGQRESRLIDELADRQFDAAIVFTSCAQSALPAALLALQAGIGMRLGYSRENPHGLLTDWLPDLDELPDCARHEVARQLELVAAVGLHASDERLVFRFDHGHVSRLYERFDAAGLDPARPYFAVHPGANVAAHCYPPEQFADAVDSIARDSGCAAVFTGTALDHALIEAARRCMQEPSVSLAGQLGLGELGALIAGAKLLLANNSGVTHLAAAVETPVVDLYQPRLPQQFPWKVQSRIVAHQGVPRIEAQAVARASLELMSTDPEPGALQMPAWMVDARLASRAAAAR